MVLRCQSAAGRLRLKALATSEPPMGALSRRQTTLCGARTLTREHHSMQHAVGRGIHGTGVRRHRDGGVRRTGPSDPGAVRPAHHGDARTHGDAPAPTEPPAPDPRKRPRPRRRRRDPQAQALAVLPEPITNLPALFIDLPDGYDPGRSERVEGRDPGRPGSRTARHADTRGPHGAANNLEGASLEAIKGRGNFTWTLEKKPYQIKFDSSTPVLGMPTAKTWILLANHADPSLLRNKVAYDLAAEFGLPPRRIPGSST